MHTSTTAPHMAMMTATFLNTVRIFLLLLHYCSNLHLFFYDVIVPYFSLMFFHFFYTCGSGPLKCMAVTSLNLLPTFLLFFLHMLIQYIWTKYILLSILSGLLLLCGVCGFFFFMSYKLHIYDYFFLNLSLWKNGHPKYFCLHCNSIIEPSLDIILDVK